MYTVVAQAMAGPLESSRVLFDKSVQVHGAAAQDEKEVTFSKGMLRARFGHREEILLSFPGANHAATVSVGRVNIVKSILIALREPLWRTLLHTHGCKGLRPLLLPPYGST